MPAPYKKYMSQLSSLYQQRRRLSRQLGMTDDDILEAFQRPANMPIEVFEPLKAKLAEVETRMSNVTRPLLDMLYETDPTFRRHCDATSAERRTTRLHDSGPPRRQRRLSSGGNNG